MDVTYNTLSGNPWNINSYIKVTTPIKQGIRVLKRVNNSQTLIDILSDDLLDGKRFYKELVNFASKKLGDRHLGEDIVSQFYTNLVEKKKNRKLKFKYKLEKSLGIEGNPKIRPWAYSCVQNLCTDHYRKKSNRTLNRIGEIKMKKADVGDEETINLDPEDYRKTPDEEAIDYESGRMVRKGVSELPDYIIQAMLLVHFRGYKYRETADILGIPVGTVKSRLHEGLIRLKESLETKADQTN